LNEIKGRASARETACRVAGGAMAENYLQAKVGTYILSWVSSVGSIEIPKHFNDGLINSEDKSLDKYKLDLMGSFEVYVNEMNFCENEAIYRNVFSKKLYSK